MSKDRKGASRRDFLKLAGTAAPAVAVAAVASQGTADAAVATVGDTGSKGYRETEHVRKYLDSARF